MTEKDLLIQKQNKKIEEYKGAISFIENKLMSLIVLEPPESISEMVVKQLIDYCEELKK